MPENVEDPAVSSLYFTVCLGCIRHDVTFSDVECVAYSAKDTVIEFRSVV